MRASAASATPPGLPEPRIPLFPTRPASGVSASTGHRRLDPAPLAAAMQGQARAVQDLRHRTFLPRQRLRSLRAQAQAASPVPTNPRQGAPAIGAPTRRRDRPIDATSTAGKPDSGLAGAGRPGGAR
jgi:hypothetical protein